MNIFFFIIQCRRSAWCHFAMSSPVPEVKYIWCCNGSVQHMNVKLCSLVEIVLRNVHSLHVSIIPYWVLCVSFYLGIFGSVPEFYTAHECSIALIGVGGLCNVHSLYVIFGIILLSCSSPVLYFNLIIFLLFPSFLASCSSISTLFSSSYSPSFSVNVIIW